MNEYDVYLPVCVRVTVDKDGQVVSVGLPEVEWDGTPWTSAPNIFDFLADQWTGHGGDETSPLWDVEQRAGDSIYLAIPPRKV